MSAETETEGVSDVRLTLIGPLPPPVHGQSIVMKHMVARLTPYFHTMRVVDVGEGDVSSRMRPAIRLWRLLDALWATRHSDAVYLAVKAGHGMWLSTIVAAVARMSGAKLVLHHHSYAYVRERELRMVALTRAAGRQAYHIVLSEAMATDLSRVMPEIGNLIVIGNAGLVDKELLELPLKSTGNSLVLGHLSNLSLDKGIAAVVDTAVALNLAGTRARLVVGGPSQDPEARVQLDRAARELGDLFEYRGPLHGKAKIQFFGDITHFLFPTQYVHEAAPLVVYEAMAAGVVCAATRQGSIADQFQGSPGLLAQSTQKFVEDVIAVLVGSSVSAEFSRDSRQAYLRALSRSEDQIADFVALLETF